MSEDRRSELELMLFLLQAAERLANKLPHSIPIRDQLHDLVQEVEFLQLLIDTDPALFEPWGDG